MSQKSGMHFKGLRHRFKADRPDDKKEATATAKLANPEEENFEIVDSQDEPHNAIAADLTKYRDMEDSGSLASEISMPGKGCHEEDKSVFEVQLNQLQDQLMAVMIENQRLQSELNSSKMKTELEQARIMVAYERRRCRELEKLVDSKKKGNKVQRSNSDSYSRKDRLTVTDGASSDDTDLSGDSTQDHEIQIPVPRVRSYYERIRHYFWTTFYDLMEDFSEVPTQENEVDPEGDPLAVKTLKENIKRFGTEAKPYLNTVKGIYDLLSWKYPPYTLIVFVVYMYTVWHGWFLPMLFFCLSFRLFINYLKYKGCLIDFNFFDSKEEDKETEDKDLGVSDKFNLVLQVARKVQNYLGEVADGLEKIKGLFLWRHPMASNQLLLALVAAFVACCILPSSRVYFYFGLFVGFKLFVIDNVYARFPRVKERYDSTSRIWRELPTELEYERNYLKSEMDKYILPHGQERETYPTDLLAENLSMDDRSFCDLFSLPESECPMPGWRGGRRCTLINREKSLTAAFKNGRLFLTHSFLCFERTKVPSPKNIVIPLADIARLEKAKPYAWIPGGGMAIEIAMAACDKPYVFGAILNRDEVYESLVVSGRKAELAWATTPPGATTPKQDSSE